MAITINTQSKDFTEVEQYLMTLDRGIKSCSKVSAVCGFTHNAFTDVEIIVRVTIGFLIVFSPFLL